MENQIYWIGQNGIATWTEARNASFPCSLATAENNASGGDIVKSVQGGDIKIKMVNSG